MINAFMLVPYVCVPKNWIVGKAGNELVDAMHCYPGRVEQKCHKIITDLLYILSGYIVTV